MSGSQVLQCLLIEAGCRNGRLARRKKCCRTPGLRRPAKFARTPGARQPGEISADLSFPASARVDPFSPQSRPRDFARSATEGKFLHSPQSLAYVLRINPQRSAYVLEGESRVRVLAGYPAINFKETMPRFRPWRIQARLEGYKGLLQYSEHETISRLRTDF